MKNLLSLSFLPLLATAGTGAWRTYEVYQPRVERHFVVDPARSPLQYNHDSSVAWYRDRWFCLWNANTVPFEGKPGQLNYLSTSTDGKTWTDPVPVFADAAYSEPPVPCPKGTQWQPNLIVVEDELWAVWSQNSRDDHNGCYLSRLSSPTGKWQNARLLWDGHPEPLIDGVRWRVFPTQNPCRLRSGRVLAPVTISGPQAKDAPDEIKGWWAKEKRNSVIYTDDLGRTWRCSPGTVIPGKSWAQWEPTVWEASDGTVQMVARNNDFRAASAGGAAPARMLTCSRSTDGGATWSPHDFVPLETVASRMHVIPLGGDRKVMVHNDYPAGAFVRDRNNLALFFTRGDGFRFVAGPGITGFEPVVAYPQCWRHEDEIVVSYSQGNQPRGIKVARVAPLPRPDTYYLLPRFRELPSPRPERVRDSWRFMGAQHAKSAAPLALDDAPVTVRLEAPAMPSGCLVDTRTVGQRSGLVVGLLGAGGGVSPFAFVHSPEHNIVPKLVLRRGASNSVAVTVDRKRSAIRFEVNGQTEEVPFKGEGLPPFSGIATLGEAYTEASRVAALDGDITSLVVQSGDRTVLELGPHGQTTNVAFPAERKGDHRVTVEDLEGRQVVRFTGGASAGVETDEFDCRRGDRIEVECRVRVTGKADVDILTVGDANRQFSLGVRQGDLVCITKEGAVSLGLRADHEWHQLRILTERERVTLAADAVSASIPGPCPGNWVHVGKAYGLPRDFAEEWPEFQVDLSSLRSRVIRAR